MRTQAQCGENGPCCPAHFSSPSSLSSRLSVMHSAKQLDLLWKNREMGERNGRTTMPGSLRLEKEQLLAAVSVLFHQLCRPSFSPCVRSLLLWGSKFRAMRQTAEERRRNCHALFSSPLAPSCVSVASPIYTHPARSFVCGCVHNVGLPSLQIGHACRKWGEKEGGEIVVRGWGGNTEGKSGLERRAREK